MTDKPLISRFTPSRTPPEVLEQIFVQRQHLLSDTLDRVRDSVDESNKHHFLFVGPRGSGKSHLVSLIAHRLGQDHTLSEHIRVAWLDEDETTTSFLDLLLRIHRALCQAYPDEFSDREMDGLFDLPMEDASQQMRIRLLKQLGNRTLVVLVENLDRLFDGLGAEGQKRWRAFIQESDVLVTVATSQRLFDDIRNRSKPFFGQFQVEHLSPLELDEAVELLRHISSYHSDQDLATFLNTKRGRSRVEAVYHLSGGNHRVFIILSEFISHEALDELVVAFEKLLDELTPYYQDRISSLPAQQRKLVEYLCRCQGPLPVKEMARRQFMSHQTASRQLKELRDKGYVISHSRGRESLYQLAEPLMRLCVEVKENRRQPIRLIVRFLRAWYTDDELQQFEKSRVADPYLEEALSNGFEGDTVEPLPSLAPTGEQTTSPLEKEVREIRWVAEELKRAFVVPSYDSAKAIADYGRVVEMEDVPADQKAIALVNRGVKYGQMGNLDKAIAYFAAVLEIGDATVDQKAAALVNRGGAYRQLGDWGKAIADYAAVLKMDDAPVAFRSKALINRGFAYGQLGDAEKAVADDTAVSEMEDAPVVQKAKALFNRGVMYSKLGESDKAISDYAAVLEMEDAPADQKAKALVNRGYMYGQSGDTDKAIADFAAVLEIDHAPDQKANALVNRGVTYGQLGESDKAIVDFTAVLEMKDAPTDHKAAALVNRGNAYGRLGDSEKAIADYDAVLDMQDAPVDQKAKALVKRASIHGSDSEHSEALAAVRIISKQAPAKWNDLASHIRDIYQTADALEFLGKGLVASLAESEMPVGLLDEWEQVWEGACKDIPEMLVPMRIFNVGVRYLRPDDRGGGDARLLYDLNKEEAKILCQVLSIESPEF